MIITPHYPLAARFTLFGPPSFQVPLAPPESPLFLPRRTVNPILPSTASCFVFIVPLADNTLRYTVRFYALDTLIFFIPSRTSPSLT
jgi:hypothetical protein